jgi:hypothetical protein
MYMAFFDGERLFERRAYFGYEPKFY